MRQTMLAPTVLLGSRECAHLPLPRLAPTTTTTTSAVELTPPRPVATTRDSTPAGVEPVPRASAAA